MTEESRIDPRIIEMLASGPRKERSTDPPEPEFSTHKVRANWFQARESWPMREPPAALLIRERTAVATRMASQPGGALWEFVGPSNVGGRMTSLVCDPNDPERLLAGAAGGGVWRSTNGGRNWNPLWHNQPSLNIGSLALDSTNPNVVYCGTGEANLSADSHPGVGLFRSLDGGDHWQILAAADVSGIPTRIGTIAVDPFDSDHIRLGGVSHSSGGRDGMFVSRDGGTTWNRENGVTSARYRCHAIIFHPTNDGTIYTTVSKAGSRSGIWRSRDGGNSWVHLTNGLPFSAAISRMSIAIAPSQPNVLFAIASNRMEGVLGVFRTNDGGDSWNDISGSHFVDERQMSYNNTIVIHPTDPGHVICGGVELHRTTNGGNTWNRITQWDLTRGDPQYAHADQHHLVMPSSRPGRVYAMNDGGMDFSDDGGTTWSNRSDELAVTMYYDLEVAQSDSRMFGGGTQDNGTNITVTGQSDDHVMIFGGDGGWMVIDPTDARHLFVSAQQMNFQRFREATGGWSEVPPLPENDPERLRTWMAFIAMNPDDPTILFTGTRRILRTRDDGDNWEPVSNVLDGSDVTAIEVAKADSNRIYVGTENGGFFRSSDGGDTWSPNLEGPPLPDRTITRIRTRPDDADTVFVTVANFGHGHVFRSHDGGDNWQDVDQGRLPDVPHHGISIPPANPQHIYVCNDAGVFVSTNSGGEWKNITRNLPNAMVVDIVYHQQERTLTAATYGRSIWRLDVDLLEIGDPAIIQPAPGSVLQDSTATFEWTSRGAAVTDWWLYVGTSQHDDDLFNSEAPVNNFSQTVSGLPIDGSTIFVKLWFLIDGDWEFIDFTYTSASGKPEISSPIPGSRLPGSTVTFEWKPNGAPVMDWWLYLGTRRKEDDLFNSEAPVSALSQTVSGLPTGGGLIFARLWFLIGNDWRFDDFTYFLSNT